MNYKSKLAATLVTERLNILVANQQFAHLVRIRPERSSGQAVLMLHGLMDDASCFHDAKTQTGLAYVLAREGYDVYLAELRGRHLDTQSLANLELGVEEAITQDLQKLVATMDNTAQPDKQIWIGQGFGSLLLANYLARNPAKLTTIQTLVHFSPFRESQPTGAVKSFWVNWVHRRGVSLLGKVLGYIPAVKLKLGRANESLGFYQEALHCLNGTWQSKDGFDYLAEVKKLDWPPSLYFASLHRSWRGSETDARAFMFDLGDHNARLIKLGRQVGNQKNYKRSELCLHETAEQDYYPLLLNWLKELP
ncbi:alpha/beta hydrolase [Marinospirillum insulare]|uniref:Alpha/beta hydrolase n=1 Tax=Marinospirillum insulare TaxID=217169 RepID=A0ABQ5ZU03_9GAMM|nr:alpha/beta fold hydrolase [Marinospirillum insulare]GLR62912.1 alpha/beta hydrolase [Marinospirillum insulare]